jgi:hypothetical protein
MQKDEDDDAPLDDAQLSELVQHLQAEEAASQASALESVESLQLWMASQPALRQMVIVDSFADIGPAILRFLRIMLGLERGQPDPPEESRAGEGD